MQYQSQINSQQNLPQNQAQTQSYSQQITAQAQYQPYQQPGQYQNPNQGPNITQEVRPHHQANTQHDFNNYQAQINHQFSQNTAHQVPSSASLDQQPIFQNNQNIMSAQYYTEPNNRLQQQFTSISSNGNQEYSPQAQKQNNLIDHSPPGMIGPPIGLNIQNLGIHTSNQYEIQPYQYSQLNQNSNTNNHSYTQRQHNEQRQLLQQPLPQNFGHNSVQPINYQQPIAYNTHLQQQHQNNSNFDQAVQFKQPNLATDEQNSNMTIDQQNLQQMTYGIFNQQQQFHQNSQFGIQNPQTQALTGFDNRYLPQTSQNIEEEKRLVLKRNKSSNNTLDLQGQQSLKRNLSINKESERKASEFKQANNRKLSLNEPENDPFLKQISEQILNNNTSNNLNKEQKRQDLTNINSNSQPLIQQFNMPVVIHDPLEDNDSETYEMIEESKEQIKINDDDSIKSFKPVSLLFKKQIIDDDVLKRNSIQLKNIGQQNVVGNFIGKDDIIQIGSYKTQNLYFEESKGDNYDNNNNKSEKQGQLIIPALENDYSQFKISGEPLNIQPCKPIEELGNAYQSKYYQEVAQLLEKADITHFRGVRGDGNCYYRAVAYGYIEHLYMTSNVGALTDLKNWIITEKGYYKIQGDEYVTMIICKRLNELIDSIEAKSQDQQKYALIQRLFIIDSEFDYAIIYAIRNITKNFIEANTLRSLNGLPIEAIAVVEHELQVANLQEYIDQVVMKMGQDAQGALLNLVPLAMRINIYIVNIDTNIATRKDQNKPRFNIQECKSWQSDIKVQGDDCLNLHDQYIYVIRKDGHYDLLYHAQSQKFDIWSLMDSDTQFNDIVNVQSYHSNNQPDNSFSLSNKQSQVNKDEQITLSCCNKRVDKDVIQTQIMAFCENDDIFQSDGKNQVMQCSECSQRYQMQDLIIIFPNYDKKLLISKYEKCNPKQKESSKFKFSNLKKLFNDSLASSDHSLLQNGGSICTICGRSVKTQEMFELPCKCSFHLQCLYKYLDQKTKGTFLQKQEDNQSDVKCINSPNCQGMPFYKIDREQAKLIVTEYKGNQFLNKIGSKQEQYINLSCCNKKVAREVEYKRLMNFLNNNHDSSIKEVTQIFKINHQETYINVNSKAKPKKPMCTYCKKQLRFEDIAHLLNVDLKEIENSYQAIKLKLRTQFSCLECLKEDGLNSLKHLLAQLISQQTLLKMFLKQTKITYYQYHIDISAKYSVFNQVQCNHGISISLDTLERLYQQILPETIEKGRSYVYRLQIWAKSQISNQYQSKIDRSEIRYVYNKGNLVCTKCRKFLQNRHTFCETGCLICEGCWKNKINQECPSCKDKKTSKKDCYYFSKPQDNQYYCHACENQDQVSNLYIDIFRPEISLNNAVCVMHMIELLLQFLKTTEINLLTHVGAQYYFNVPTQFINFNTKHFDFKSSEDVMDRLKLFQSWEPGQKKQQIEQIMNDIPCLIKKYHCEQQKQDSIHAVSIINGMKHTSLNCLECYVLSSVFQKYQQDIQKQVKQSPNKQVTKKQLASASKFSESSDNSLRKSDIKQQKNSIEISGSPKKSSQSGKIQPQPK